MVLKHDLVTEAVNTKCYIWNIERYDPNGGVRTLSIMCTEEEYDHIVADPDMIYLIRLRDNFLKELRDN